MVEKLKITILTDKTSWMSKYNIELLNELTDLGHIVRIINCKKEIQEGDIAFFLSCFEIIESEKLKLNKHNIVVHESKLPQGKGWSPMSWQILERGNTIPITLFEAGEKADSGDIYLQDEIILSGYELIDEWQGLLAKKTIEMCMLFVKNHPNNISKKQKGQETFYKRRTPKDSELDINKTIKDQFNLLRIVDNEKYPAFFEIDGHKYKLRVEKYEG